MAYKRQRNIFSYLLNTQAGKSGAELARIFKVSTRTIRSDVKSLNQLLAKHNISIQASRQEGYFIAEEDKELGIALEKKIFSHENDLPTIPNTPSERKAFIVFKLAFTKGYITMEEFAKMLFVSKTTVYLDIKKILEMSHRLTGLKLHISPIKGIRLEGEEKSKRILISNMLKRIGDKDQTILAKSLRYVFEKEELDLDKDILVLHEIIMNILNKHGYILTDTDASIFTREVFIVIKRIQLGFTIDEMPKENLELSIAKDLSHKIEESFDVSIDDTELGYLQQCLNQKRLLNVTSNNYVLKEEAEDIIEEFLQVVKDKYYIDFATDQAFKRNLMLHLNPMIERLRANYFEKNPLKNQIKVKFPFAFEISMSIVPIVKEKLGVLINESEVSYIALHVAVALENIYSKTKVAIVCGSGLGTARLIKSRIRSIYNEQINIVGYYPVYKLNDILNGEYGRIDLIISTIPIPDQDGIPIIQVDPLITNEDLTRIRQFIDNPSVVFSKGKIKRIENNVFKEGLFKHFLRDIDYLDAILELTKMLKKEGYITDINKFYESVIERENLYSTILKEGIAIPHPMMSMSKTSVVAVGTFKEPIYYDDKKVEMILLFAVNAREDEKMQALYCLLQDILDSKQVRNKMVKATNFRNFITALDY